MPHLEFHKLHGLGNDFVLVDAIAQPALARLLTPARVRAIADRKRGVGFDQLLLLTRSRSRGTARLDIFNADASRAEMCGNGLRAAALYLFRKEPKQTLLSFDTAAGERQARATHKITASTLEATIECEMGVPRVLDTPKAIAGGVTINKKSLVPICVNVGNPHAVFFETPRSAEDLARCGSKVENHKAFPARTNVEFVRVRSAHQIEVQVWERGVGRTEACGTGAIASAIAAIAQGLVRSPVQVRFPGGVATVRWDSDHPQARLTGTACYVFEAVWRDSK